MLYWPHTAGTHWITQLNLDNVPMDSQDQIVVDCLTNHAIMHTQTKEHTMIKLKLMLDSMMEVMRNPHTATWIWFALTVTNGFLTILNLISGNSVFIVLLGALTTAVGWRAALRAGAQRDAQA